jgi:soluble lytic murein transglycosylase-like protein
MTDHPRRRADDAPTSTAPEDDSEASKSPRRRRRSARDFFHRFRRPLVGLGIAGAASPMIQTGDQPAEARAEEPQTTEPEVAAGEPGDLEDRVANRIGETTAVDAKEDTIRYAIDRYGIDRDLAEDIYDSALKHNIEPKLAYGLVKTESAFRHDAISHVGARGLTQVMPRTAAWLQPGTRPRDLHEPGINLSLGFRYLNQLINKYNGDVKLALLAYNRGPGTVDKILKRGGDPDNGYARKVMDG